MGFFLHYYFHFYITVQCINHKYILFNIKIICINNYFGYTKYSWNQPKNKFSLFCIMWPKMKKKLCSICQKFLVKLVNHRVNQFREIFSFFLNIHFVWRVFELTFFEFSGPLWLDFHSIYHSTKKIYIHTQIKIITVALGEHNHISMYLFLGILHRCIIEENVF